MAFSSGISKPVKLTSPYQNLPDVEQPSSGNNTNFPLSPFNTERALPKDLKVQHYQVRENLSPIASNVDKLRDTMIFIEPSSPFPSKDENIHSKVEMEAKRQGYTYENELMVYINEDGEGKTWDDFFDEMQNQPLFPGCQPFEEISSQSVDTNNVHSELEKEKISLITRHLLNFDIWLQGLNDSGWQISTEGKYAFTPQGEFVSYDETVNQFPIKKKQFQAHLEACGFQYEEKSETIFKGKSPATFVEVIQIVKNYLPADAHSKIMDMNPEWIESLAQIDSRKTDIFNLFAAYLQFDEYLFTLESSKWKIDYEQRFAIPPGCKPRSFDELNETVFLPMQEQFLSYLDSKGFSYNSKTQEFSKGNASMTVWQAEVLAREFKPHAIHPNFEDVKTGLKPLMDYSEFIKVLKSKGYAFTTEEELALHENWINQRDQTILTFAKQGFSYNAKMDLYEKDQKYFMLEQLYDTMKVTLLKLVAERANEQLGMKYDPVGKCFKNDFRTLTTEDVLLEIMIQDFGL